MRDVPGRRSIGGWTAAVLVVAAACACSGPALAQDPPIYEIPIPTPTPTGTPFQNPAQSPPAPSRRARLNPFPYVRTAGSFTAIWTTFTRVLVRAPKGALLDVKCSAGRCKHVRRLVASSKARRVKSVQRRFKPRTAIEIRISSPASVGKYVRIRTRRGAAPVRRDRCLLPGSAKPVSCEGL
jgi:hypothetical protein